MSSLILATTARLLMPLLLLFSLVLLLRGHYEPGGGFVGGLVAGASFVLFAYAEGVAGARRVLRVRPMGLIATGLTLALASGLLSFLAGETFLTGLWSETTVPVVGRPGTPFLFDIGVYLVVLGTVTAVIFELMESEA